GATTTVIRNDAVTDAEAVALLAVHDGHRLSPGPGVPADFGVCPALIRAAAVTNNALFGVCRGRRALGEVIGDTVSHAPIMMRGKTSLVEQEGASVFGGCRSPLTATRYHSLAIVDDTIDTDVFEVTAQTQDGIVMGIQHRAAPVAGVQFHPESVL